MSLLPANLQTIPPETRRVAQAAFPKGNLYVRLRDELGPLYEDEAFADLFPSRGRPAESPGRLALITVFQFAEGLSDRAAAEAVRSRVLSEKRRARKKNLYLAFLLCYRQLNLFFVAIR